MPITITRHISGISDVEVVFQQVRDLFYEHPEVRGTIDIKFIPEDENKWQEVESTRPIRLYRHIILE